MAFDEPGIRSLVADWYAALDRHDELSSVLPYLVEEEKMVFPEITELGHDGFAEWYKAVTSRFFDEVHTVREVTISNLTADRADLTVVVNWQCRIWNPPTPKSLFIGFDAYQTWEVVAGSDGQVQIKTYIVDKLEPMPGSASL